MTDTSPTTTGIVDTSAAAAPVVDTETPDVTGSAPPPPETTFADLGVSQPIVSALGDVGITKPFPIQALTLPVALQRQDIIGQAKTGTGKTLGFGIPLLEDTIAPDEDCYGKLLSPGAPQALVIVPTRELAKQVAGDLVAASRRRATRILEVYGGRAYEPQINALKSGVDVVVGTPGRLIDLMKQKVLSLASVGTVVLDEADEMLDLGFLPDVETLLSRCPATRHTMLFSATMPGAVVALARRYMTRPTHIRAQDPADTGQTVTSVKQVVYRAHALNKVEMLARILQARGRGLSIVFTRTKRTAAKVSDELIDRGFSAAAIHGDLGQGAREQALRAFRHGKVDVLVATDVAARGIDVDDVTHVINYQCPEDEKIYLHRIGRTARAGNAGTAVTFVDWDDVPRWSLVNNALGLGLADPPETYHTSDHLYADLDIPEGTGSRLPRHARTRAGLDAEEVEDLGETGRGRKSGGGSPNGRRGADSGSRGSGTRSGSGARRGQSRSGGRNRRRRRTHGGKPADGS